MQTADLTLSGGQQHSANASAGVARATNHYPALDGFRAVAVLLVFFHHYLSVQVPLLVSGWMGVELFFVLSGFLITGILFDSRNREHRLRDFYVRRVLRIFPLYYGVWVALLLSGLVLFHWQWNRNWILWPMHLGNFARFLFFEPNNVYHLDILTNGGSLQRWLPYAVSAHFWTLCIEEQFYLVWPVIVFSMPNRKSLIRLSLVLILLCPLVRVALLWIVPEALQRAEFIERFTPVRMDAFIIGGLLALALRGPERLWIEKHRRWISGGLFGSAAIVGGAYLFATHQISFPTNDSFMSTVGFSMIDVGTVAVLVELIHEKSLLSQCLRFGWLRKLGQVSYGFYVFHEIPRSFYHALGPRLFPKHVHFGITLTALVGTLSLSFLSYWFFETPFLRLKKRWSDQTHRAPET